MSYSEIYCDAATGNNMNGGYPIGGVYPITYTNGNWSSVTGLFIPIAANPTTDGVTVDDLAAVFVDGATTPAFYGRVTARDTVSLTVSITRKIGTIPTTGAAGLTCKIGGALKGPNAAVTWPAATGNVTTAVANAAGDPMRVNYKGGTTYAMTVAITSNTANMTHQGYTTTPGDKGKATFDWGTTAVVPWSSNAQCYTLADMICSNNGTTGTNNGISITGSGSRVIRCIAHDIRGNGINISTGIAIGCEAYACNTSNTANLGGFNTLNSASFIRCISHDNSDSNSSGFTSQGNNAIFATYEDCTADSNGSMGFKQVGTGTMQLRNCDIYNNTSHGIDISNSDANGVVAFNCNFVNNGGSPVNAHVTALSASLLVNCAYGSGTEANGAANAGKGIQEIDCITYAADITPWVDPANGDFRINLTAAKGTGYGSFTQTAASYAGAIGYPDIGSNQHQDAGGAANSGNLFSSPIVRAI